MHNMKPNALRCLKVAAWILPVLLFLLFLPINDLEDTRRVEDFFLEEKDSLDVVFLGASDVYAGFSPVLAYEEYGFTSYDYTPSGNFIHYLPGQIRDVLRVQSPQLLVIDLSEVSLDKGAPHDAIFRQYITGTPLSKNKIELIDKYGDKDHLLSYYLPFCTNHGNTDIASMVSNARSRRMIDARGYSLLKGSMSSTVFQTNPDQEFDPINTSGDTSRIEIPAPIESNVHYLLSYCKENVETPILFVNFPRRITTKAHYQHHQVLNSIGDLVESYGYDYVNLSVMTDEIGLDANLDYFNDEHLNLYGQYKTTRFLSDILTKDYGVTGQPQTESNRAKWEVCKEYRKLYFQLFEEAIQSGEELWMKEEAPLLTRLEEMKK